MNESRLEGSPLETTLKRGAKRSVRVERDGHDAVTDSPQRVVKRFHASGLAGRLDGRRARREHALLRRLTELGLPVPRPLELRRADGRFELVSEWIEGAVPLSRVLAGAAPWPVPVEALAGRLGGLLARLHAAGLEHGDLHGGNVLLDASGDAWLVDLSRARVHADPATAGARAARVRDLVQLGVETREVLSERLRTRFFVGWTRAARELGFAERGRTELAAEVERAARLRRRANVARHLDRWTRASGVAEAFELERARGIVRAGLDAARALDAIGAERDDAGPRVFDGTPFGACLVVRRSSGLDPRRAWRTAARLEAHHLPAPRPWCLVERPEPLALFGLPRGLEPARDAGDSAGRMLRARGLGALSGALADRGLRLDGDATHDLSIDREGALVLGLARHALTRSAVQRRTAAAPAGPFGVAWSAFDERERAAWTAAWIAAQRGGADERRRLAAEHGLG